MIKLNDGSIIFKAVSGKYWSVDEKSLQVLATSDKIGENEKFELLLRELEEVKTNRYIYS